MAPVHEESAGPMDPRGMRVALFHHSHGMISADLMPELDRLGCQTLRFDVTVEWRSEAGRPRWQVLVNGRHDHFADTWQRLEAFDPDLILLVDGMGLDLDGLLYLMAEVREIPLINWFVDDPYFFPATSRERDLRYVCYAVFDPFYARRLQAEGYRNAFALPLGVNPAHFTRLGEIPPATPEFPVLFVGNSGLGNIESILGTVGKTVNGLTGEAWAIIEEVLAEGATWLRKNPGQCAADYLDDLQRRRPTDTFFADLVIRPLIASVIDFRATFERRRDLLNSLAPLGGAVVIGDAGWAGQLDSRIDLRGKVSYGAVGEVYRRAAVNVNVSRYQLKETVNQRVFDVPAAGAFLITDYRPGIESLYELDREMVCYRDATDLAEKVGHFLARPDERARIALAGRQRALRDHTYAHRFCEALSALEALGARPGRLGPGRLTARALPPHLRPRLLKLAARLREGGLEREMDAVIEVAARVTVCDAGEEIRLADELEQAGLPDRALSRLDRLISERPDALLCLRAACLARDLGLYREAVAYGIRTLELDPRQTAAGGVIRDCFAKLGEALSPGA